MYARSVLAAAALAAGCGRIGFDAQPLARGDAAPNQDGDAAHDAAAHDAATPACTSFGPWSTPAPLAAANSASTDWGPTLSADMLELVFSSDRSGAFRLYDMTRSATGQPWSAPALVAEIPTSADDPSLSTDRLELYWGGGSGVAHATRATLTSPWTNQTTILGDTAGYTNAGGPDISRDGLSLLFTATATSDNVWHEWITGRSTTSAAFTTGLLETDVTTPLGDSYGSIRGDGLEIMYATEQQPPDLYAATRPAPVTGEFGSAALVTEINSPQDEGDPDLSDDGTTLTFASDRTGSLGWDIYQSTRSCQ